MASKVIKTEEAYQEVLKRIEELLDIDNALHTDDERDELELLTVLVVDYENHKYPMPDKKHLEQAAEIKRLHAAMVITTEVMNGALQMAGKYQTALESIKGAESCELSDSCQKLMLISDIVNEALSDINT